MRLWKYFDNRNDWIFFGSDEGGKTAAVLRSFIATCQRAGIDPFTWLQDVLSRIAAHPITRLTELLPHNWTPAQVCSENSQSPGREYPRASVTTRLGKVGGRNIYYGPFPSRAAAEKFANDSLDFFKMRRCVDDLHPDPQFPGCIYSEMKMCLAPCFKGCTDEDYQAEVGRVQSYFESSGNSLVREITAQRDQASTSLDFENAAALHAKIEKLKPVLTQLPEIVRRIDQLTAVIVQPSAAPESVVFFFVDGGLITGPLTFPIQATEHTKSQSMEARLQSALATLSPVESKTSLETMEHLALLKRWFYRSTRTGEIFFADLKGGLPLRRLVRGIARVYRGEKPEPAAPNIEDRVAGSP